MAESPTKSNKMTSAKAQDLTDYTAQMPNAFTGQPPAQTNIKKPVAIVTESADGHKDETIVALVAESALSEAKDKTATQHVRGHSFHVKYSLAEVSLLAKEIYDGTVADVHLSLFTYWVCEKLEHYQQAKRCIRELGLDQGYQTSRIENSCLRRLLEDTHKSRPVAPPFATSPPGRSVKSSSTSPPVRCKVSPRWPERCSSHNSAMRGEVTSSSNLSSIHDLPPNTPDRPAPLNVRARGNSSVTSPTPKTTLLRSASSPVKIGSMCEENGLSGLVLEATNALTDFSLSTEINDGGSDGNSEAKRPQNDNSQHLRQGTSTNGSLDLPTLQRDARQSIASLRHLLGDLYESDLETDVESLAESDRTATTETLFPRGCQAQTTESGNLFDTTPRHTSSSSQGTERIYIRTPGTTIRFGPSQNPPSIPLPDLRPRLPASMSRTAFTPSGSGFSPEYRRIRITQASSNEDTTIGSNSESTTDRTGSFHGYEDSSLQPLLNPNTTLAPRRYDVPASNATSSSNFDLPLRHMNSQVSLSSFRQHRELKAAHTPTPARPGDSQAIEGATELTMRIGHKTLSSRPSRIPTPSRIIMNQIASSTGTSPAQASATETPAQPPQALPITTAQDPIPTLYQQISSSYLESLLQRTRARGALLPSVDHRSLLPDQIAWRDVNGGVIEAVYGRKDVFISEAEIKHVEKIAVELSGIAGETWVAGLFGG